MHSRILLTSLGLAAGLAAQDCPRPQTQLSSGTITTSYAGFTGWKTCSPKQNLPADVGAGLEATARVVYAIYPDADGSGNQVVSFRRSVDGGWSFEAPVAIWTTLAGESAIDADDLKLTCDGHNVFVTIEANRDAAGNPAGAGIYHQWIVGSKDQGQTWQAVDVSTIGTALSTGDVLSTVDDPASIESSNGRCHVVFNARYSVAVGLGGLATADEDNYYQAVEFDGTGTLVRVFAEERQVEGIATGTFDSDDPWIAADGNLVVIAWQDISGGGTNTTGNDTYTITSGDGGVTFGAKFNHTNFAGGGAGLDFSTRVEVEGNLIVVTYADARSGGGVDRTYVSIDQTGTGSAFVTGIEASKAPAGIDNDNVSLAVGGGRIYVGYEDVRTGRDEIYVVVDRNGGNDFLGGTTIEHLVSSGTSTADIEIYPSAVCGDVYAISYEPDDSSAGEGAGFAYTTDGGLTFHRCEAQASGASEVDDCDISVTLNGDITLIYQTEPNGTSPGNSANNVFFAGAKVPMLRDDTAIAGGITYTQATPSDTGNLLLLLFSLTPPTSNGTIVPPGIPVLDGVKYNFTLDSAINAIGGNIVPFLDFVDANGEANFALPNVAQLLGTPVWYVAVSVDGASNFDRAFTDPLRQN